MAHMNDRATIEQGHRSPFYREPWGQGWSTGAQWAIGGGEISGDRAGSGLQGHRLLEDRSTGYWRWGRGHRWGGYWRRWGWGHRLYWRRGTCRSTGGIAAPLSSYT